MAKIQGCVRKSICIRGNVKHTYITGAGSVGGNVTGYMDKICLGSFDNAEITRIGKNVTGYMDKICLGSFDNAVFEEV